MNTQKIEAQTLSSRKLLELATQTPQDAMSESELADVLEELARRTQDLQAFEKASKLSDQDH